MQKRNALYAQPIPEVVETERQGRTVGFSALDIRLEMAPGALEQEWRRLEQSGRTSLHQGFDWCRAWCDAQDTELFLVQGTAGGETWLLLPLEVSTETGLKVARFPGGRFNNINTGLFDPMLAVPDAEELQNFAVSLAHLLRGHADLIALDNVPLSWRGAAHPLAGLATIENQNRSFQLPLFPNFEATLSQLNAKGRRKKFRSQMRKLEAIGGFEHIVATGQDSHALLELFFRQKGERLTSLGLPDVFASPETRQFFHNLLNVPAENSNMPLSLHAIRLKGTHDGHIAAIAGLARKGDHVICLFSSIDESIAADASPGELLFWLMIEQCCHNGVAIFDFGIGDQLYKRSWCSQETIQHDLLIPVSWKGSLARPALIASTKAKAAVKRNPRLYSLLQRWRSGALHNSSGGKRS
ncbi:GNAT family N-acetyltransferase [Neorhizobium lilium]|uniref:GNAT family N-acetyltransferase n=1 Tax=Neorhizobium lilium TaxID=2503024 RepID=A0A444LDA6_9HYPH|nr:GNAT family N-acetyltransferase [Neorhizobium lilium]RWX75788.1 GNAT family N-acetyltransferase [Neorhizobium lilium]